VVVVVVALAVGFFYLRNTRLTSSLFIRLCPFSAATAGLFFIWMTRIEEGEKEN